MKRTENCGLSLFIAVTSVLLRLAFGDSLQLSILPSGPVIEGTTIIIRCRATPGVKQPLDIIRLVRQVNGELFEITSNNVLSDVFQQTGRYQIVDSRDNDGQVDLRITHIQGADGGNIGCRLLSSRPIADVFTDLIINVPPRVEFLHHSPGGDTVLASEAELLHLPQGVETTITCRVTVIDTDFIADVMITSGAQDVTSRFLRNMSTMDDSSQRALRPRGFAPFIGRVVEYQLKIDPTGSDVASLVHGRNVTCAAKLPHFNAVAASIRMEVAYKPRLRCESQYGGLVGEVDFEVVCTGRCNPHPNNVVWSWIELSDVIETSLDLNGGEVISAGERVELINGVINTENSNINNREELHESYSAIYSPTGNAQYEFRLRISRLRSRDFRRYELEVANEIGRSQTAFNIVQVFVSTPRRPSVPRTTFDSNGIGDQPAESWQLMNAASCLDTMTLYISMTIHSFVYYLARHCLDRT